MELIEKTASTKKPHWLRLCRVYSLAGACTYSRHNKPASM